MAASQIPVVVASAAVVPAKREAGSSTPVPTPTKFSEPPE